MAGIAVSVSTSSPNAIAGQSCVFLASVKNNTGSDVTLSNLAVYCSPQGPIVGQPQYLTVNVAPGTGNPTITNGSTGSYPFNVVFPSPNVAGVAPQNAPGSASIQSLAYPAHNQLYTVYVQAQTSDGSVGQGQMYVQPVSSTQPLVLPYGGSISNGTSTGAANIVTDMVLGIL